MMDIHEARDELLKFLDEQEQRVKNYRGSLLKEAAYVLSLQRLAYIAAGLDEEHSDVKKAQELIIKSLLVRPTPEHLSFREVDTFLDENAHVSGCC